MSEQSPEIEYDLPPQSDPAFASLMDILVGAEEGAAEAGAAGGVGAPADAPAGAAADTTPVAGGVDGGGAGGHAQPGQQPAGAAPGTAGDPAGDPGGAAAEAGAGDRPAAWTATAADIVPRFGELSTALEENTAKAYQAEALAAVKTEHAQYFSALEKHPRLLVGQQVPAIGKEGHEVLRDTNDAREWQEAVKSILVEEVRDRASRQMESSSDFLATVHASIELFQNNPDLIPMTKDFDTELANRFATMAKPYELRVEGKLQGYSIPVQPIIDQLRTQVQAERAKAPAPAAPAAPAKAKAPAAPPQAGVPSKAGSSDAVEDFSTLFGTIGLPNLQI